MARKIAVAWAAEDSETALHARYRAEAVIEVRTRLHARWLLRRGESPAAVAAAVGRGVAQCAPVAAVVPGGGPDRGAVPSAGRSGQALLPDAGAGAGAGGGSSPGGVCDGGCGAGLDRGAVRSGLHRGQSVHLAAAAGDPAQDAAAPAHASRPPGPGGLEKGGLKARLKAAGLQAGQGIVWGDEMRVGLRGQVRQVWAPRGVAVSPDGADLAGSTSMWRSPSTP